MLAVASGDELMHTRLSVSTLALVATAASFHAFAQQPTKTLKEQLVGTWDLVSTYSERPDGSRFGAFGANPTGRYMLDTDGRFSYMIYGSGRPKFASNNRLEGTADEYKAAVQQTIAFYGTYTVDEASSTVTWHVERCTFPNWEGSDRKTVVTLNGDDLSYTADAIASAAGPYVPHVTWKRAR
jgi:hypothetical protein